MARHSKPTWWSNLVPQRWRRQSPLDVTGPYSQFAASSVEKRLASPEWVEGNSAARRAGAPHAVTATSSVPAADQVVRPANAHRYPT